MGPLLGLLLLLSPPGVAATSTMTPGATDSGTQSTSTMDTGGADTGGADTGGADTGGADTGGADTGIDLDADGDGFTPRQGDCDDQEPEAAPGQPEICEDRIDNDCDGLYDEDCDTRVRMASLRGGGGCTRADNGSAAVFFLPLIALFHRRRR